MLSSAEQRYSLYRYVMDEVGLVESLLGFGCRCMGLWNDGIDSRFMTGQDFSSSEVSPICNDSNRFAAEGHMRRPNDIDLRGLCP